MKLTIGFSPCPNDTFIFDAMVNKKIDTQGIDFEYALEDVETLNRWAADGNLDITKLSYNAFLHTTDKYALLHSGSALGKGVGPLLVAAQPLDMKDIAGWRIAIPGRNTTANLLLSLAYPEATNKTELVFSTIEDAVLKGEYDAGLVIHESRFTYQQKGLHKLADLGDWWEREMYAPIPLGGIVIRSAHDKALCAAVDDIIRQSVEYAWRQYPALSEFVMANAQEMDEDVMRRHISLYVNEYTTDLGTEGTRAINKLFETAMGKGLIKALPDSIFYSPERM